MCCTSASTAGRTARGRAANRHPPVGPSSGPIRDGCMYSPRGQSYSAPPLCAKAGAAHETARYSCSPAPDVELSRSPLTGLPLPPAAWAIAMTHGLELPAGAACTARNGWEGLPLPVSAPWAADLNAGAVDAAAAAGGDGSISISSPRLSPPSKASPFSAHSGGAATAPTELLLCAPCTSRRTGSSAASVHSDALHVTTVTADVAAAAAAAAARRLATGGDNDDDDDYGDEAGDPEIRALLRPGGSPCLPLEDGWELMIAAQRRNAAAIAAAAATAAGASDELLPGASRWWPDSLSDSRGDSGSDDGLGDLADELTGEQHGSRACGDNAVFAAAAAAAAAAATSARHRACQFGYTDSAPAHATAAAAAAAAGDMALAFLRAADGVHGWRQALGCTLSAPPAGMTAAAAAAAAAPSFGWEWSIQSARDGLGDRAPTSAAPPPMRSAAAAAAAAKPLLASAGNASRWALAAAHDPTVSLQSASGFSSLLSPPASQDEGEGEGEGEGGIEVSYFGAPLEGGMSLLLHELGAGGGDSDGGEDGALTPRQHACVVADVQPAPGGMSLGGEEQGRAVVASRALGQLGRGLLGCFIGVR